MRKTWFYRLLFSYLPVFFAIALSLLLLTYLTLNEMSKRSAVKANELLSQSIIQFIDNKLKSIDDLMLQQLLRNEKIRKFFNPPPGLRLNTDYEASGALTELVNGNPLISSVYLYRTSDYRVLTSNSYSSIENFGDKQYIGSHINRSELFRWETSRLYSPYPERGKEAVQVISLAKFGNLANGSLMVVNINVESLSAMIRSMSASDFQYVELIDDAGRVVASKEAAAKREGEAARTEPNDGKALSYAKSVYTGWTIRSGNYKSNALEWVSSLFYVWIAFGFAVIAAGIVWLVYVTRRNYRPIQAIAHRIAASGGKRSALPNAQRVDELKFIETAVEDLLDSSMHLQEENAENLVYRRSHMFLRLLDGREGTVSEPHWRKELERLGIDIYFSGLVVAVAELDKYADFCAAFERRDQSLYKLVLKTVNSEINGIEVCHVWAEWLNERQLGLLFILREPVHTERYVMLQTEKLREWTAQNLPFTITVGVGTKASAFASVTESYRTAAQLLYYKASLGCNRILTVSELVSRPHGQPFRHLTAIRELSQAYRANDGDWERTFEAMREHTNSQLISKEELSGLFHYLIDHLHKAMDELPEAMQAFWDGAQVELYRIAAHQETAGEMFDRFQVVLRQTFERMRELRESKSNHQLIRNVKRYIGEHYGDPDLSLASLSSEFGLGGSYMSRLFKEEFGVKFIDYLTQVRVEQAIAILNESQRTVQEIAEAVGYIRPMTFIRVFKKITGTTPGSYRKARE